MANFKTIKFTEGDVSLDVRVSVEDNTIWLTKQELAILFSRNRSFISRVIKTTYKDNKLSEVGTCAKNAHMVYKNGRNYYSDLYNIDVVKEIDNYLNTNKAEKLKMLLAKLEIEQNSRTSIIYNNGSLTIDVTISPEEETVWLTQVQISLLFETSVSNISMHIKNILKDGELNPKSVIKDFLSTAQDNKQYLVQQYNLDMILAIGYRIKGKRAVEFRKWVSNVLKEYMIKGYAINESRTLVTTDNFLRLENEIYNLKSKVENFISDKSFAKEKIIFKGEVFDAYELISSIISKATKSIKIIDPYFDYRSFIYLKNVPSNIERIIYKSHYSTLSLKEIHKFMRQYGSITIIDNNDFHDRFIIIDDRECYSIGTSLNYAGTKTFGIIKIETKELVEAILSRLN